MSRSFSLPQALLRRSIRVVRPRDLGDLYANPSQELARLASSHLLLRLAHGYYAIPPMDALGDPHWRPSIESATLALAAADHSVWNVALVGISAARLLGHVPRALGTAVAAVPVRRRPLQTTAGRIDFWQRDTGRMETQVWEGELGRGRISTTEQAILDIAASPRRGGVSAQTSGEALRSLSALADWPRTLALAESQGLLAAYRRARWVGDAVAPDAPILERPRHPVAGLGLEPTEPTDRTRFGVRDD